MKKAGYLRRLRKALKGVPQKEVEGVVDYCCELIDDGVERGKSEAEVCRELDSPEQVAENYIRENGRGGSKEESSDGALYHALLPVRIIGYFLGAIWMIVLAAIVFAFAVTSFVLFVSGIYVIIVSFGLFSRNAALAFVQIGAGIVVEGVALIFLFLTRLMAKTLVGFARWMGSGFRSVGNGRRSKGMAATLTIGLSLGIAGAVVSVAAFGGLNFDYRKLVVADDVVRHDVTIDEPVSEVKIALDSGNVSVELSNGEFSVSYAEWDESKKSLNVEDGTLSLTEESQHWGYSAWNRGLLWGVFSAQTMSVVVRIPGEFAGSLDLDTKNGAITVKGVTCDGIELTTQNGAVTLDRATANDIALTTQNGMVIVSDCTAETIDCRSQNGMIALDDCRAKTLYAKTQNGMIALDDVDGDSLEFHTGNGNVSGSLAGEREDYRVFADVGLGSCNLQSGGDGDKKLTVTTGLGAICIVFDGE